MLEALNLKFNKLLSRLEMLNNQNENILEKLEEMHYGPFSSLSEICDNILDARGDFEKDECITLFDLKKAIEQNNK